MGYRISKTSGNIFVIADNQQWTAKDIAALRKSENIIFDANGVFAIYIEERNQNAPIFHVGVEDDGSLFFDLQNGLKADVHWLDNLMTLLKKTKLATEKSKAPAAKASDKKTTPAAENEEAHNG
jgi:hypothetical protein